MANGEVKYNLGMDGAQFAIGANQALELLGKIGHGAISVAEVITEKWRKLADLNDLAGALRTTAADLYTLQRGMEAATGSSAGLTGAMAFLRRAISGSDDTGSPTADIFTGMGLDPESLKGRGPQEQILKVLEALNELDDESKQFAARRLFGGQAQEMIMAASQMEKITQGMAEAADTAEGIDAAAESADRLLTSWNNFKQAVDETTTSFAGALLPEMMKATGLLDQLRQPFAGKALGQEFRAIWNGVTEAISTAITPEQNADGSTKWDTWASSFQRGYDQANEEMAAEDSAALPLGGNKPKPAGTRKIPRVAPAKEQKEARPYVDNGPGWPEARTEMGDLARIGGIMGGSGSNESLRAIADATKRTASFGERTSISCEQMSERLGNMKLDFANT